MSVVPSRDDAPGHREPRGCLRLRDEPGFSQGKDDQDECGRASARRIFRVANNVSGSGVQNVMSKEEP